MFVFMNNNNHSNNNNNNNNNNNSHYNETEKKIITLQMIKQPLLELKRFSGQEG